MIFDYLVVNFRSLKFPGITALGVTFIFSSVSYRCVLLLG